MHMRYIFTLLLAALPLMGAQPARGAAPSREEALAFRRLHAYWKEKDWKRAEREAGVFLQHFPDSRFKEAVACLLGDLALRQKNYTEALSHYAHVKEGPYQERAERGSTQALYLLMSYEEVVQLLEARKVEEKDPYMRLLFADSLMRARGQNQEEMARAELLLQGLLKTEWSGRSHLLLAFLLERQKKWGEAALHLREASKAGKESDGELLFRAAQLEAKVDPHAAATAFLQIARSRGIESPDSWTNGMNLLFQEKRYNELIALKEEALAVLPAEHLPEAQLLFGWSHYAKKEYALAAAHLEVAARLCVEESQKESARLALMNAAMKSQDSELMARSLSLFEEGKEEWIQAHLIYAQLLHASRRSVELIATLDKVEPHFTGKKETGELLAQLYAENSRWDECARVLMKTQEISKSSTMLLAQSALLSFHAGGKSELLLQAIERAGSLGEEGIVFHLRAGELLHEKGLKLEAVTLLEQGLAHPAFSEKGRARFAAALAFTQHDDPARAVFFAEDALLLDPELPERARVMKLLFNAYSDLGDFTKAAQALYAIAGEKGGEVKEENLRWLAHHYAREALSGKRESFDRAKLLLAKLFEDGVAREDDRVVLAGLYAQESREQEALPLLERGVSTPNGLHLLATLYKRMGRIDAAQETLEKLVSMNFDPAAKLELVRMKIMRLPKEQWKEEVAVFRELLTSLKDLELERDLETEPAHTEAALDYAALRASEEGEEKLHHLLTLLRDELSHQVEVASEEKLPLMRGYLRYVEGEILLLEAKQARLDGKDADANVMEVSASALFQELRETKLSKEFEERLERRLETKW